MSTHNIGFYEDLTKIIFELSSNIIKYAPYFFCCFVAEQTSLSFTMSEIPKKDFLRIRFIRVKSYSIATYYHNRQKTNLQSSQSFLQRSPPRFPCSCCYGD